MKKISVRIISVLLLILFLSPVVEASLDRIVAKVGSEVLTMNDLSEYMKKKKFHFYLFMPPPVAAQQYNQFKSKAIQELVLDKLLEQELRREGIRITPDVVEAEFQSLMGRMRVNQAQFSGRLRSFGLSLAEFKSILERDIAKRQFSQKKIVPKVSVSEYDLQKEYEKHKHRYKTYKKFDFIEVYLTPETFKGQEALQKMAKQIQRKLATGGSAKDLIKKYSSGVYASKSGSTGMIEATKLRPEIRNVLTNMKPGQTSPLLPFGQGIYIFKLLKRADPIPVPYNQVSLMLRNQYGQRVMEEELRKYLLGIKDQTYVEITK